MLSLKNIIQQPESSGSAAGTSRYMSRELLNNAYRNLKEIKKGLIGYNKKTHTGYIHVQVPSTLGSAKPNYMTDEDLKKFKTDVYYDVVIAVDFSDGTTITNLNFKVFSNSPNFQFTYAYVLNQSDSLVNETKHLCMKKALTDEPKTRNPNMTWGFEKTVFFAIMYLKSLRIMEGSNLYNILSTSSNTAKDVLKPVMHAKDKLHAYERQLSKFALFKKKVKHDQQVKKKASRKAPVSWSPNTTKNVRLAKLSKKTRIK